MTSRKAKGPSSQDTQSVRRTLMLPDGIIDALNRAARFQNATVDDFVASAISTSAANGLLGIRPKEERHHAQIFTLPKDIDNELGKAARERATTDNQVLYDLLVTLLAQSKDDNRSPRGVEGESRGSERALRDAGDTYLPWTFDHYLEEVPPQSPKDDKPERKKPRGGRSR